MSRSARLLAVLPLVLLGLTGCTSDEPFIPKIYETNFAASLGVDLDASIRTSTGLYYRDIVAGGGLLVPADTVKKVTITYVGTLRNAKEFDSGNLTFDTNASDIILGMIEGVKGMRIGGTRQLVIPSALAYGDRPQSGVPAYSILVFQVTLLNVTAP